MAVDIKLLYPVFRKTLLDMLADMQCNGYTFIITDGYRGEAQQNLLYAKGRTVPGPKVTNARWGSSPHGLGIAADIARQVDGKISWKDDHYAVIGKFASQHGLVWGGDWASLKDKPHLELDIAKLGLTLRDLFSVYKTSGLSCVWKLLDTARAG